jgi:hypothetical protein
MILIILRLRDIPPTVKVSSTQKEKMMLKKKNRLTALLAIIPGLLSIKEGGSVLLGLITKEYTILPWLVWYNVVLGFASVIVGIRLWRECDGGIRLATTILLLHGLVLIILILLCAFKAPVSLISIMAMLFRTIVWIAIMVLLRRKGKEQAG